MLTDTTTMIAKKPATRPDTLFTFITCIDRSPKPHAFHTRRAGLSALPDCRSPNGAEFKNPALVQLCVTEAGVREQ
ncbi:MAG: hypothetical protein AAF141_15110, partial [Pseudomonadota bacterium]